MIVTTVVQLGTFSTANDTSLSVVIGSQAEMCQLQAGDEVLTVNRQQVAEMSYTDWKSCMEEALQEGSLVMDVRRHGKNSESSECVSVCV